MEDTSAFDNPNFQNQENDEEQPKMSKQNANESEDDNIYGHGDEYGWLSFRPKCLQWLNNPKGFIFFLCVFSFGQGMTVNGLVYVVTTTLERRFNFPSVQSAFISSSYDFYYIFFILFVTYFGDKAHKPKLLGATALVFTCGSIVFTLPHFLTGPYNFEAAEFDTCDYNRTEPDLCSNSDDEEALDKYYAVFLVAQALHAIGSSCIYTLGVVYIDENSPPASTAIYIGILCSTATLGPAAGFLFGGMFLDVYTDLNAEHVTITPKSPLWVGAWWLGFVVTASIVFLVAIPLLGFSKHLPTFRKAQKQRVRETRAGAEFEAKTSSKGTNKIFDFPKALLSLLKNPTYVFIDLANVCEGFILAFLSVFGPKIVESVFNMSSGDAALATGIILAPSAIIGPIGSGYIIRRFDLKVHQILKMILMALILGGACFLGFFLYCPNVPFAGVTIAYYQNTTQDYDETFNLTAPCNNNCRCEDSFEAVCGSDGVMYYSSCHAGCLTERENGDGTKEYSNCTCIPVSRTDESFGAAVAGRCGLACSNLIWWLLVLFGGLLFAFVTPVPYITTLTRCVDYSQRSFALGLNTLLVKGLATVPSPIAFGALVDKSCLLWEYECSGSKNCWVYSNYQLSLYTLLMALGCRIGSIMFYLCALISYKSPEATGKVGDGAMYKSGKVEMSKLKSDKG